MQRKLLLPVFLLAATGVQADDAPDYSAGVFIVNEDWYGHQNSTINYFDHNDADGNVWQYRVVQSQNPGKELGCTNQFGTIYGGLFFNVAKQERDPGAGVTGGRISIADATTMKLLYQSEIIDPSGRQCDGRACLGVDENTFYISTSNGVWIFDVPTRTVTGMVEGTENPNGTDGKPNSDPTGSLYHGQCGSMVRRNEFVYVAHQSAGLLIIDPESARVVETITMSEVNERAFADGYFVEEVRDLSKGAGIGSVVLGADGNIWYSVAKDIQGLGATLPYIVRVDPDTHSQTIIRIPDGVYPPANSWYAWTPDGFCAAAKKNVLYWNGGPNSWFSSERIYRYDIDSDEVSLIIDFNEEAKAEGLDDTTKWKLYGCSTSAPCDRRALPVAVPSVSGSHLQTAPHGCRGCEARRISHDLKLLVSVVARVPRQSCARGASATRCRSQCCCTDGDRTRRAGHRCRQHGCSHSLFRGVGKQSRPFRGGDDQRQSGDTSGFNPSGR